MPRYYSPTTGQALITFVNQCFSLDSKIDKIEDLSDGLILSNILRNIDSRYDVQDLEKITSPAQWLVKKKSLETVYKSLQRYLRENDDAIGPMNLDKAIDINAIAEHGDAEEATKLLGIFIVAAMKGPTNEKYIRQLMELEDPTVQAEVAKIIQLLQPDLQELSSQDIDHAKVLSNDLDLALEEAHASLLKEHDLVQKRNADLHTRIEHLTFNHDELRKHSEETDNKLRTLEAQTSGDEVDILEGLRRQIQEQNDLIESQEHQVEADRVERDRLNREIRSLRPVAERALAVEDELKEAKIENASLSRKANAMDHYQKKLQALGDIEKENASLREQIDTLQANQQEFDRVNEDNAKLRMTMIEYKSRFDSYEIDVIELSTQKSTLQQQLAQQNAVVQDLKAKKAHDDLYINELMEKNLSGSPGPPSYPSPTGNIPHLTLEEELAGSNDSSSNYPLEVSRLKAEVNALKGQLGGTTYANLRADLEDSQRIRSRLEESLRELQEKHAIGQQQLSALISKSDAEKDEAVARTRKFYMEAIQELNSTKAKLSETQAELSNRNRELLEAKADLSAVDREDIDALEDLKATHEIVTSSFRTDLILLQEKFKNLTTDHEQKQSHLIDALLAKDRLTKQIAELRETRAHNEGSSPPMAPKAISEQAEKQDKLIQDLQRKLKAADEAGADAQKVANEAIIKNLSREIALISSAWHELSSRLQSNHVVLQRRQDASKSWLNKQRQMVNSATPRR